MQIKHSKSFIRLQQALLYNPTSMPNGAFYKASKCTTIAVTPLLLTCSYQEHVAAKKQQDHGVDQHKQTSHVSAGIVAVPLDLKRRSIVEGQQNHSSSFLQHDE